MNQDYIKEYILKCKSFFAYAGLFSFFINLLTLVSIFYMLQLFDRVITSHSNQTLFMLTFIAVFMIGAQHYLEVIRANLFLHSSLAMQKLMQKTVLACMLSINKQGDNNRHGLDDVQTVQAFFSGAGVQAVFEIPWIPIYFVVMYLFHPLLSVLAFFGVLILVALTFVEEKVSAKHQKSGQANLRKSQDIIDSSLKNVETINAMSMHEQVSKRWSIVHDDALSNNVESAANSSQVKGWSKFVRNILTTFALALAAYLIINDNTVTPGIMIASTMVLGRMMSPIDKVISSWRSFIKVRGAYERLNKMLDGFKPETSQVTLQSFEGNIKVEKVFFSFTSEKEILRNIDFQIAAGDSLGIIGNSAAGKTSLIRLLIGIYKPNAGVVRLDGADIFNWNQTKLLGKHIGYLAQTIELFSGTVAENIARLEDTLENTEKIIDAAKLVGAHDFILRLPNGYDTEIGEGGKALSAGQRQMVGLARAVYGNPKLVVLDEPNANLDGPSELNFMKMMQELKKRKVTLIIVSHKPSVLKDIDKLLVLEQGKQLNFGNRDDVMQNLSGVPKEAQVPKEVQVPKEAQVAEEKKVAAKPAVSLVKGA